MMLSVTQTAVELGLSESTVRRLAKNGEIKYFQTKKGGRMSFDLDWIREYKSQHTKQWVEPASRPTRRTSTSGNSLVYNSDHGFN